MLGIQCFKKVMLLKSVIIILYPISVSDDKLNIKIRLCSCSIN
jgi:hypothetical protein